MMRKGRFTETHIVRIQIEVEVGRAATDVCRENDIAEATYYNGKAK